MAFIPAVKEFVLSLPLGKFGFFALFLLMYLVLGMLFDSWSMLFLTFPFVMPIITALGFNPIWWGVIYVIAGEQSTVTPPFGLSLFVLRTVVPHYPIGTIVRGALPMLIPVYLTIAIATKFPELVLWFPSVIAR